MTYKGTVINGVVVIDGEKPAEGTRVEVTPVEVEGSAPVVQDWEYRKSELMQAAGAWADRTDLPADSTEAARKLRKEVEQGGVDDGY